MLRAAATGSNTRCWVRGRPPVGTCVHVYLGTLSGFFFPMAFACDV